MSKSLDSIQEHSSNKNMTIGQGVRVAAIVGQTDSNANEMPIRFALYIN